jgi:hypothetical protein
MSTELNEFSMSAKKGQLASRTAFNSDICRILDTSVNTFYGATAVKLVDDTEKEITVEKAGVLDQIYGFVQYNSKKNARVGGDRVDVLGENEIMYMEAGGAFNRGAELEYNPTGDKVIVAGGTNTKIGLALDKSTADGDLVRVKIKTPSLT